MNQATIESSSAAWIRPRSREPILFWLLVIDFALFASGAVAHLGVRIPLGFGTWSEPLLVPATIVEGVGALASGATLVSLVLGATWSRRLAWWALWYCFAGVLWGMGRLAVGAIPAARTVSNKQEYTMADTKYRPHQTTLERVMGALNVLPTFVLRLPFQTPMSRRLVLLTYTGRKSGRSYTIPVSYVEQGDTLLIPGGGAWKHNLEQGSPVRVRLRGSERSTRPEVIKDSDEVERLVAFMMAANPAMSRFIGVPREVDGRPNRERLEQVVRAGFAVVQLHLDQGLSGIGGLRGRIDATTGDSVYLRCVQTESEGATGGNR